MGGHVPEQVIYPEKRHNRRLKVQRWLVGLNGWISLVKRGRTWLPFLTSSHHVFSATLHTKHTDHVLSGMSIVCHRTIRECSSQYLKL